MAFGAAGYPDSCRAPLLPPQPARGAELIAALGGGAGYRVRTGPAHWRDNLGHDAKRFLFTSENPDV